MALQTRSDMELWDRPFQTLLIGVLGVNILAHVMNVSLWVLIGSAICLGWKLGHLYRGWPLPPRRHLYFVGGLIAAAVIWEHKTMFGHEAATPILVFLASLKLLETNRDRDARFIIVTSYFLLMAHLLHSQSLLSTFFMAFDVAIITILMFQLHRADRRITLRAIRPVVRLLVFTIPVWLCLFIVFPRFTLKTFQRDRPQQTTGFSESLDPGSVSGLAQSDDVAFRVQFLSGPRRPPEALYWRGAVLYDGEGLRWKPRAEQALRQSARTLSELAYAKLNKDELLDVQTKVSSYEVLTDTGAGRATFTLPTLVRFETGTGTDFLRPFLTDDNLIRLGVPKREHAAYRAFAVDENIADFETLELDTAERSIDISFPVTSRLEDLARTLRRGTNSAHAAMSKIDDWFVEKDFRYTLSPGDARSTTLEDFLFKNRQGFCEHYAAASATLLRLMGYHARVVVGYQGGKWNSVSEALIVRSKDAHAWVEVWASRKNDSSRGRWVTYDPTASIAPLRLRLGGDFLDLPEEQQRDRSNDGGELFNRVGQNLFLRLVDQTSMLWDYAQMSWTQFLLNYDRSGQRNLLNQVMAWFGLKSGPWLMVGLIVTFLGVALRLVFLWYSRGPRESALRREWNHLEKELHRIGAISSPADGPLTIRERVSSDTVRAGIDAFIALQYASNVSTSSDDPEFGPSLARIRRARHAARKLPNQTSV